MVLTKAKTDLVAFKDSIAMNSKLVVADAMILIRKSWEGSFTRIETSKKATSDRGWNQCNRALLDHPEIRATVTSEEKFEELSVDTCCKSKDDDTSSLPEDLPEIYQTCLKKPSNENTTLNFNAGFAASCLDKIAQHQDSHEAIECAKVLGRWQQCKVHAVEIQVEIT